MVRLNFDEGEIRIPIAEFENSDCRSDEGVRSHLGCPVVVGLRQQFGFLERHVNVATAPQHSTRGSRCADRKPPPNRKICSLVRENTWFQTSNCSQSRVKSRNLLKHSDRMSPSRNRFGSARSPACVLCVSVVCVCACPCVYQSLKCVWTAEGNVAQVSPPRKYVGIS